MPFLVYVVRIKTNKDVGLKRMLDRYPCFADKDIKDKCVCYFGHNIFGVIYIQKDAQILNIQFGKFCSFIYAYNYIRIQIFCICFIYWIYVLAKLFSVCGLPILFHNDVTYTIPENFLMPLYGQSSLQSITHGGDHSLVSVTIG